MGATPFSCCKERINNEGLDNPNKFLEKIFKFDKKIEYISIFSTSTNSGNVNGLETNPSISDKNECGNLDRSQNNNNNNNAALNQLERKSLRNSTLDLNSKLSSKEVHNFLFENYISYNQIYPMKNKSPTKSKNLLGPSQNNFKDNSIVIENIEVLDTINIKRLDNSANKVNSESTNTNSLSAANKKGSIPNLNLNTEDKNYLRDSNSECSGSSSIFSISSQRFSRKNSTDVLRNNFFKIEDIFQKNPKFKNYRNRGALVLDKADEQKPSDSDVKASIQTFFDKNKSNGSLLILVGSASDNLNNPANFILETHEGDKLLLYREIFNMWINRKSKENNQKLLIIIDACYSGMWVQENIYNYHFSPAIGIYIQASCNFNQVSKDNKKAGPILVNFLLYNNLLTKRSQETNAFFKTLCEKEDYIDQNPSSIGFYFDIKKHFNIELMFDTWNEFDVFSKTTQSVSNEDNFTYYIGEMKNSVFHGKGIFYYPDGEFYEGDFKNGKKEGKGIYYYSKYSNCEKFLKEEDNMSNKNSKASNQRDSLTNNKTTGNLNNNNNKNNQINFENVNNDNIKINESIVQDNLDFSNILPNNSDSLIENENSIFNTSNLNKEKISLEIKYIGSWKNDKIHGKGIYYYPDGERYEGDWVYARKSGIGRLFYSNGLLKYTGEFESDKLQGKGVFYYSNGEKYEGDFKNCKREGKGNLYDSNGKLKYIGDFKNNKFHGFGIYYHDLPDGVKKFSYEGEFNQNKFEGIGKIFNAFGALEYEGCFKNGLYHGFGVFVSKDGEKYEGGWIENKRNGKGSIYYADGALKYEGDFLNDTLDGKGIYYFKNGEVYVGNFENNSFCGFGIMLFEDGEIYEGHWNASKREGLGTLYYPNGLTKYRGQFENDRFNGTGKFFIFSDDNGPVKFKNQVGNSNLNHYASKENPDKRLNEADFIDEKHLEDLSRQRSKSIQNDSLGDYDGKRNKKLNAFNRKIKESEDIYSSTEKTKFLIQNIFNKKTKQIKYKFAESSSSHQSTGIKKANSILITNENLNVFSNNFFNAERDTSFMNFEDKLDNKNIISEFKNKIDNNKLNKKDFRTNEKYCIYEIYYGEFKDNLKDGFGVQFYPNGTKFEGEWKANKRNGYGTFFFESKEKFIGEFIEGRISSGHFIDSSKNEIEEKQSILRLIEIIKNTY